MSFMLKIITNDGVIISPRIAPNNPNHGFNHISIKKEILKFGNSLMKRDKTVIAFECLENNNE